jgi:hypothetical protein
VTSFVIKFCGMGVVASLISGAALALDEKQPFIEFSNPRETVSFDLRTVKLIQPGKFTISNTTVANPDYMKVELNALDIMREHCSSPDGNYEVGERALAGGEPDLPVKAIKVASDRHNDSWGRATTSKLVTWELPYSKFHDRGPIEKSFVCKYDNESEAYTYQHQRSLITNGTSSSMTFDCRRELVAFGGAEDYVSKPPFGSYAFGFYFNLCEAVIHERPFVSELEEFKSH